MGFSGDWSVSSRWYPPPPWALPDEGWRALEPWSAMINEDVRQRLSHGIGWPLLPDLRLDHPEVDPEWPSPVKKF